MVVPRNYDWGIDPSGHGLTGYFEAFILDEIAPDRRTEILARATTMRMTD